jgi:anaerobic selenocysteine-containing dehydrogenase
LVAADGHRITSVRGDYADPFSQGYICPKAAALPDLHDDPDRLRSPLVREGTAWRGASWTEALDRAGDGLARIRRDHGRDAVAVYYGNPVVHNLGLMTHALPFTRALRTRNVYSASSADQLPQMLAAFCMFGHLGLIPVPDVDRVDLFLILGANPIASNGSLMTAPNIGARLRAARQRGGRVIVVDPRRTETAAVADEHLPIRPGTDALFLAAMIHVIITECGVRLGRFEGRIKNLDRLTAVVGEFPPARVAARTGIPAETTRRLARAFAQTERAACYGRVGTCTQRYGTLTAWLIQALNVVTAHLDEAGGMMGTTPAIDVFSLLRRVGLQGTYGRWRSRGRSLPEFGGDLPIAALADEITLEGPGRVRALITIAGNPALSAPDGRTLATAISRLEHVVAIDPYLNETTRHAHVILPPAPPLARPHYDLALFAFSVRNVAKYSDAVVPRAPHERHDWEILTELAARLFVPGALRAVATAAARRLTPERLLDLLLRAGPYRLSLSKLRAAPHGMDLGPLDAGAFAHRIATPDGAIDLAPDEFVREARNQLAVDVDKASTGLVLIGRRQMRSNNSWLHNSLRLVKGPDRCTLIVHPSDAAERHLATGGLARLDTDKGSVIVPVEVTDDIRPGVVSLPHGWGHDRDGTRLSVASAHAGASVNDVTSTEHLDSLSGNAAFNGLPVRVTALSSSADGDQPPAVQDAPRDRRRPPEPRAPESPPL